MSSLRLDDIRAQFPDPVTEKDGGWSLTCYCVGGALSLLLEPDCAVRFPDDLHLAYLLEKANRHVPPGVASACACSIIAANDLGDFDAAWSALGQALEYRHGDV